MLDVIIAWSGITLSVRATGTCFIQKIYAYIFLMKQVPVVCA